MNLFLYSCNREQNQSDHARLQYWDAVCDSMPAAIADSLKTMNPQKLSRANRAWHGLLKTVTDDKTYVEFASDSLINAVERYYRRHGKQSPSHIRSLIYQGIVRSRMGVTDSTVYEPLKEALRILNKQKHPDIKMLYFANYYMGDIHQKNENNHIAKSYFQQMLMYAKQEGNKQHLFDAYLATYWYLMHNEDYSKAKLYLDTLEVHSKTLDNKYLLLIAQGTYFDIREDYEHALLKEKELLLLTPQAKEKQEYFKIHYSLSNRYYNLNQLDSASYYAQQSIAHITDSAYQFNYLLYGNAADIASAMGNHRLADEYRTQALEAYDVSVEKRLDTQILELEKRYDLSEAENRVLIAKARYGIVVGISIIGIIVTVAFVLFYLNQRKIEKLKREKLTGEKNRMETEKQLSEAEALLLRQQTQNQRQMLSRYASLLKLHAVQQQHIRDMANRVRARNADLGDAYDEMLKTGQRQLAALMDTLFTAEDIQRTFGISDEEEILNEGDRLLLYMLANESDNDHIAALLNTTPHNLKSKKSYLKKKIAMHANSENGFERLQELF